MKLFNFSKFIPDWFISRERYFFLIGLDLLIIYTIYYIQHETLNLNNLTICIFTGIWILTSYTFGRYKLKKKRWLCIFVRQINKSIIFFSCFSLFIYLFTDAQKYQLLLIFTQIILFSSIGQILINKFITYYSKNTKYWLFVGKEKTFLKIKKTLEETRVKGIIKFYDKRTNAKIDNNFDFIVFEYSSQIKNKFSCKDYKNIKKITLHKWALSILQRIPNEITSRKSLESRIMERLNQKYHFVIKRFADIFFSIFLIVITFPVVIVSIILIKLEDRGPIFYSQIRSGLNGKEFRIWKLRTMYKNSETVSARWAVRNDKRITKIGKLLRRTRIDELPQLLSIILGKMSLIGPRPERPEFDILLEKKIPNYQLRYKIKPGLSGWAQVNYNYGSSIEDAAQKLSYDLFYISQFSIWMDFLIFFKTIYLVFNGRGSEPKEVKY